MQQRRVTVDIHREIRPQLLMNPLFANPEFVTDMYYGVDPEEIFKIFEKGY